MIMVTGSGSGVVQVRVEASKEPFVGPLRCHWIGVSKVMDGKTTDEAVTVCHGQLASNGQCRCCGKRNFEEMGLEYCNFDGEHLPRAQAWPICLGSAGPESNTRHSVPRRDIRCSPGLRSRDRKAVEVDDAESCTYET